MSIYDVSGNIIGGVTLFVNVKSDFGAKGDGVTNDALAIQAALDSVKNTGGTIFFPEGTYKINTGLLFYSNQTLWFENGATLLQGAEINNLLMSYCQSGTTAYNGTHDCLIYGATFDGGNYEENNTLVGICHCKNIVIENCKFVNAYGTWHNLEINSAYNCKVINCEFEGSRKTGENGCMIQVDSMDSSATWPWSDNRGAVDSTVSKYIEICGTFFHSNTVSPAIGNHSSTAIQYLRIHDCIFDGLTSTRAAIGFQSSLYVDIFDNTFVDCTYICNDRSGSKWTCHDNKIDGATSVGGFATKWNNFVDGTLVP